MLTFVKEIEGKLTKVEVVESSGWKEQVEPRHHAGLEKKVLLKDIRRVSIANKISNVLFYN